jgi:hypothetical protein
MEITLLFPQELGRSIFSPPSKGVCNECFLNHSSSLQPHLSTWIENTAQQFLYPETNSFFSSLHYQRVAHALPPPKMVTRLILFPPPLCPRISSLFFPSSTIFCGSNPHFMVMSGSFHMGTLPISSLTLEEDFPTTNLTGNLLF